MKLIKVHDDQKVYKGRKWWLEAESKSFWDINSTHDPNNRNWVISHVNGVACGNIPENNKYAEKFFWYK